MGRSLDCGGWHDKEMGIWKNVSTGGLYRWCAGWGAGHPFRHRLDQGPGKTQFLGASTTFVRARVHRTDRGPRAREEESYFLKEKVKIDWQFMLVVGIFILLFMYFEKKGL